MRSLAMLAATSVEPFSAILVAGGECFKLSVMPVLLAQQLVSPKNALEQPKAQSEIRHLCAYVEVFLSAFSYLILHHPSFETRPLVVNEAKNRGC